MLKTYTIQLDSSYRPVHHPTHRLRYEIPHAARQSWESENGALYEQTFDGRFAFLYVYECWAAESSLVRITTSMGDLHLLYAVQSDAQIRVLQMDSTFAFDLREDHGAYCYLAKGVYNVLLPPGHHLLIGFILDAGMFRPPANRHFHFLKQLVDAKRAQSPMSCKSADVWAGPTTMKFLEVLFKRINPYLLDNEYILLKHLIFLINLSRYQLIEERSGSVRPAADLLTEARQVLEMLVMHHGAQARLADVAKTFGLSAAYLSRLHRQRYSYTFQAYRNRLLLRRIHEVMQENGKFAYVAEQTGFSGTSEMARFIRNQTGLTCRQFKEKKNLNI